jgi:hypothetical protein
MSTATRTNLHTPALPIADGQGPIRAQGAREQPQGRQRREPEAPADGVHRRLRLLVARVRTQSAAPFPSEISM